MKSFFGNKIVRRVLKISLFIIVILIVLLFSNIMLSPLKPPKNTPGKGVVTNVLLMGIDDEGIHTDVLFLIRYDTEGPIDIISIPRDTKVNLSDEVIKTMEKDGSYYLEECKITEVHAFGSEENRSQLTTMMVEDLLECEIDYFVRMELEGFRKIVDAIGGVEIDIKEDMYRLGDPGDITIDLKKGKQNLNGEEAEQLVRYRGHTNSDIGRIEMQHLFLKEFARKVLNTKTILNNITDYVKVFFEHLETDMPLSELLKYVKYIDNIDVDNISMHIIPGESVIEIVNNREKSYFINDIFGTRTLVDKVMSGKSNEIVSEVDKNLETDASQKYDDKELKIYILNAGTRVGFAAETKERLEKLDYKIVAIDTYREREVENTIIYVREEGMGLDLLELFNAEPMIIVDESQVHDDADIMIILGSNE